MAIFQVFLSARSAFRAYPGCLYPISLLPGFIRRSRKIFPPPLCGRLVLLDARKTGEGAGGNTSFEFPLNSSFTIPSPGSRRSVTTSMNINPSAPQPACLTDYFNPVRAIIVDPTLVPPSKNVRQTKLHIRFAPLLSQIF